MIDDRGKTLVNENAPPRPEPKLLYRRLDRLFGAWKYGRPQRELLESFLDDLFATLGEPLRLRSCVLYGERRSEFALLKSISTSRAPAEGLPLDAPPISLLAKHRVYIFSDPEAESAPSRYGVLAHGASAGILVGRRPSRYAFFFRLDDGWMREELDFALNTIRAALGSRITEERMRGTFAEAAEIQQSLLLEDAPDFPGYEFACRSVPAEEVGGDFYDFIPFNGDVLAVAVGDASGHGLPAALLVRDVVTGLRMGIAKDMKITPVFEKLNDVIHRSNLSSRFVSVFYGELESNGNLIYVNAGHLAPWLFLKDRVESLTTGGTVIGPLPEARFKRGFAHIDRGSTLVLTTDGLMERRNSAGEFFSEERLQKLFEDNLHLPPEDLVERAFREVVDFGGGGPFEDDATLVIVRRHEGPAQKSAPPSL
ncbi:MAG: PP2C family protein-serine/threonine phosphatase [Vicinamibacteria bacterium]|nr:PP2C family protein-serine/threonine phosphatase [Vicinamibacteria bacterium]